ncbi:restriction endonuclease subunit S [Ruminococcus sp.]|uniref:restriction endonuclease subunit S n=1 Tax=Ruminococcus sp. TaxID=41978 RepID=UPI002E7FD955|nr:restriction endonuclease subunit S [Ruminococcus sp.]MEE3492043.1 restriction endonuclease subunit S [Ruminococcus sp.]
MNSEIKQRIEQIKNGEIPKGYKKGKLGIVPEDWEEVCFSSLFTSNSDYTDDLEKYPLYSLTIEDGITAKTDRYNRAHLVKKENSYKIVRPNDYAYNPMNIRFGAVARHKGDTPVAVSGYYDIFTTVHPSDLTFMDNFLTCGVMITYYNKVSTGSLVEKQRVHFSDFLKFSLPLPPLAERERIAKILSAQDKVIECYEKKIEQLKRMKKYYLQNMFPKRGETVPKIRFKGFTNPWEQRKLGEVFVEYSEKGHEELPPLTIIQGKGTILREESDRNLIYDKSGLKNYKLVNQDDFILHLRSFEGGLEMANTQGIVSPAYHIFHGNNSDTKFYYPFFRSKYFISVLLKPHVYGIRDGKSIDVEGMKSIYIPCPSIEEQNKIGDFFSELDNLITLHQRKLEEEKKKKKALQQLLLTGIVRVLS